MILYIDYEEREREYMCVYFTVTMVIKKEDCRQILLYSFN